MQGRLNSRANPLLFVLIVARCLSAAHAVLAEEALYSAFSVNNLLSAGVKWVISRPNIYMQFWLGRANGHNNLTVAVNFSIWIPLGVNISFSHCSFCDESYINYNFQVSIGAREWGVGGDKEVGETNAPCPCPIPNAQFSNA